MAALRNLNNSNTWSGAITLGSASRINSDAGNLILTGGITGATQNLTVGGAGSTTINSVIGTTSGTLTKDGAGTLTLSGATSNTYSGLTTVSAGELDLKGSGMANAIAGGGVISILGDGEVYRHQHGSDRQYCGQDCLPAAPWTLLATAIRSVLLH